MKKAEIIEEIQKFAYEMETTKENIFAEKILARTVQYYERKQSMLEQKQRMIRSASHLSFLLSTQGWSKAAGVFCKKDSPR